MSNLEDFHKSFVKSKWDYFRNCLWYEEYPIIESKGNIDFRVYNELGNVVNKFVKVSINSNHSLNCIKFFEYINIYFGINKLIQLNIANKIDIYFLNKNKYVIREKDRLKKLWLNYYMKLFREAKRFEYNMSLQYYKELRLLAVCFFVYSIIILKIYKSKICIDILNFQMFFIELNWYRNCNNISYNIGYIKFL